jgi:UDP-glucose 4-epimerase
MNSEEFEVVNLDWSKDIFNSGTITNLQIDLQDQLKVKSVIEDFKPEVVIHLAALKSVIESVSMPDKYYDFNGFLTGWLAGVAKENGCKKFIFASSAAVYGSSAGLNTVESTTLNPVSPYGRSKVIAEELLDALGSDYTMQIYPLRIFNLLGFGREFRVDFNEASRGSIQYSIWESIKYNKTLKIFGNSFDTKDGTAIRDYIHPNAVAACILGCINSISVGNTPINVGSGIGYSVNDLILAVESILGEVINREILEARPSEIAAITADISRLKQILNVAEGIQDVFQLLEFLARSNAASSSYFQN